MSTIKVDTIQNTSGVQQYLAKAWVNFNGTQTVAIRASGNVSSITDNGTGDYAVNFSAALTDANYAVLGSGREDLQSNLAHFSTGVSSTPAPLSNKAYIVLANNITVGYADSSQVHVQVTR